MIDVNDILDLPHLPLLGLASRCALSLASFYENLWEDSYSEHYHSALKASLVIATTGTGIPDYAPAADADICVDIGNLARAQDMHGCAHAANAAAGAAYAADMMNDLLNGCTREMSADYHYAIVRAVNSSYDADPARTDREFHDFKALVASEGLGHSDPIDAQAIEKGFSL